MILEISRAHEYLTRRIDPAGTYDGLLSFPKYIEVETVNVCNARCPMCTIDDWERGAKPMTDEIYGKIAAELGEHADHIERVSLYRDGEPLIDKKLALRTAMLKSAGIKNVAISTNVSLLNERRATELLEAGIDVVIMSIDSLDKDVFESIRVRLVFEEVMENAMRFIELRNRIRPQTQVWMRMIRQESNHDEWPAYRDFWSSRIGAQDRVYYHTIFNWGNQLKGFKSVAKSFEPNLPCVALWSLLVIFCNGDVPLCNVDYNNKYPTGNVVTSTIEELWRSAIVRQRREWHLAGEKMRISPCQNCNVWDESPGTGVSEEYVKAVEIEVS